MTNEMSIQDRVSDILVVNDLNFEIKKLAMMGELKGVDSNGNDTVEVVPSNYYGLYNSKSKEIINTVKAGYTITQNSEIVEMVLRGADQFGELKVQNAGSINGGRKVYIQLRIEGDSKVGNDTIQKYVTIIDSNDGSTGLSVGIGDLTMSCQNQFFQFYKSGIAKFRHTATIADKVRTLPTLISNALADSMKLMELYNEFQSTSVSRDLAHKMVNHLLGFDKATSSVAELSEISSRNINAMDSLYNNIETEMNSKGDNLWGLHSGVTRWTTHEKSAPRRDNGRLESVMMGTNYRTNQASLEFAKTILA